MKSLICGGCALGLVVTIVVFGPADRPARAADDDTPSIEKIMEALNKGRKSPLATLKGALKSQTPDWATIQKEAKTYAKYAGSMPKNKPPTGDEASYQKLAKDFAADAKALDQAASKKELAAANAAFKKIGGSCKTCHDAHRED